MKHVYAYMLFFYLKSNSDSLKEFKHRNSIQLMKIGQITFTFLFTKFEVYFTNWKYIKTNWIKIRILIECLKVSNELSHKTQRILIIRNIQYSDIVLSLWANLK